MDNLQFRTHGGSPSRFAVDDVPVSSEKLSTEELLAAVQEKLQREVLLSPLADRRVVYSGIANPLVEAIHDAFSRHLPLTLSPDSIWLTILQGFSHHVNENAEALRGRLVRHRKRCELRERVSDMTVEEIRKAISGFSRQIREATDPVLHETLVCDFTTTTTDIRTASEIALMDTYSQYFEFSFMKCICGIPHITLTGTVQDWQRIRDRIEVLATFELEWWVERLRPILDEFVRAASGQPDRRFWRSIYKFRPGKGPYDSRKVTGWVVNLFPYLGDAPMRRRSDAFEPGGSREIPAGGFPSGLCSVEVDLKLTDNNDRIIATQKLDLVAGLLGVEQSQEDGTVSPVIGWCLARQAPTQV